MQLYAFGRQALEMFFRLAAWIDMKVQCLSMDLYVFFHLVIHFSLIHKPASPRTRPRLGCLWKLACEFGSVLPLFEQFLAPSVLLIIGYQPVREGM